MKTYINIVPAPTKYIEYYCNTGWRVISYVNTLGSFLVEREFEKLLTKDERRRIEFLAYIYSSFDELPNTQCFASNKAQKYNCDKEDYIKQFSYKIGDKISIESVEEWISNQKLK